MRILLAILLLVLIALALRPIPVAVDVAVGAAAEPFFSTMLIDFRSKREAASPSDAGSETTEPPAGDEQPTPAPPEGADPADQ